MAKSLKLTNDNYWDAVGIQCPDQQKSLKQYLKNTNTFVLGAGYNSTYPVYYLLAVLPPTSNANSAVVRITGTLGAYEAISKVIIDILIANRNGVVVKGSYNGSNAAGAFSACDIRLYTQSDGSLYVYYVEKSTYVGGCHLEVSGNNYTNIKCSTTEVSVAGTHVVTVNESNLSDLDNIEQIVVDYTLTANQDIVTFNNLNLDEKHVYDIHIEGTTTGNTDIYTSVNGITTNYWQMGRYYSAAATDAVSGWAYTTGTRANKPGWYYAHSFRPQPTVIDATLSLTRKNASTVYPFYKWRTMCIWSGYQMDADCFGVLGATNITSITSIKFDCDAYPFAAGTRFIIKKRPK